MITITHEETINRPVEFEAIVRGRNSTARASMSA